VLLKFVRSLRSERLETLLWRHKWRNLILSLRKLFNTIGRVGDNKRAARAARFLPHVFKNSTWKLQRLCLRQEQTKVHLCFQTVPVNIIAAKEYFCQTVQYETMEKYLRLRKVMFEMTFTLPKYPFGVSCCNAYNFPKNMVRHFVTHKQIQVHNRHPI